MRVTPLTSAQFLGCFSVGPIVVVFFLVSAARLGMLTALPWLPPGSNVFFIIGVEFHLHTHTKADTHTQPRSFQKVKLNGNSHTHTHRCSVQPQQSVFDDLLQLKLDQKHRKRAAALSQHTQSAESAANQSSWCHQRDTLKVSEQLSVEI